GDKALFNLALVYEKTGKKQEAIRAWKNYLTLVLEGENAQMAKEHIAVLEREKAP
ncbi:MAG: hypothetical protein HYY65_02280, partial [Candidatus Tectomicrobia bacterium]|nr:hypothetical protein [Candidatus Tectomicrobia bacterium]